MPSELDRHDRSRRFIRSAFFWDDMPTDDLLMDAAAAVRVTLRLAADSTDSVEHLVTLAAANMVLRLPFKVCFAVPNAAFCAPPPSPYAGPDLRTALDLLARELSVPVDFVRPPNRGGTSILIETRDSRAELWLGTTSWIARLSNGPTGPDSSGNAISAYAAATMATAEMVKAWARTTASIGKVSTEPLRRAARLSMDSEINLWRPGTREMGPTLDHLQLPSLDWVGGGAVTQAALCVLLALPNTALAGRVSDPKKVDEPDLNRSILAFTDSVGVPKPEAIGLKLAADSEFSLVNSEYPPPAGGVAPWIVCGADDVSVRPKCQSLWPDQLLVIATEDQFAQVSRHAPNDEHFCGGCFAQAPVSGEPAPTIVSTSVLSGVFGAATIARLAIGDLVPARTDILAMRLDTPMAVSEVEPAPNPSCQICGGRRRAS